MQLSPIKINFNSSFNYNLKKRREINTQSYTSSSLNSNPIAYLNKAQISFGAMKKTQFSGIDLIMIERAKLPISKFNSNKDLQNYCQTILEKEYLGEKNLKKLSKSVDRNAKEQKQAILKDWIKYITKENCAYTPAIQLFILSSITKNLNSETNYLPPILNKGILATTISEITDEVNKNSKFNPNFEKMYKNNIQKSIFEKETQLDPNLTGWIRIPSKQNDPKNFKENIVKLQTLSHNNWCTKSYNAKPYLEEGDFWVYLEQGKPKLGVRFNDGKIAEIQGENNNSDIPVDYHSTIHSFIDKHKFQLSYSAQHEVDNLNGKKGIIDKINTPEGQVALLEKDWAKILPIFGVEVIKDENGNLILSHYSSVFEYNMTLDDIGLKEEDLFKKVIKINGDANFRRSKLNNLGVLEEIGGDAHFHESEITSLANLRKIGQDVTFSDEDKIKSLGALEYIGRHARFDDNHYLTSLENIKEIGGVLEISEDSKISSLGELEKAKGIRINNKKIHSLGNIEYIPWSLEIRSSSIRDLGKLKSVGCGASFPPTLTDLGQLEYIGFQADFSNTNITSLGNLREIGGIAIFTNSKVVDLGKLKKIGHSVYINKSLLKEKDFKNIEYGLILK